MSADNEDDDDVIVSEWCTHYNRQIKTAEAETTALHKTS